MKKIILMTIIAFCTTLSYATDIQQPQQKSDMKLAKKKDHTNDVKSQKKKKSKKSTTDKK